ncbi:MAG: hypothetical protein QOE13_1932 [Gaiellaceae bacterium]|jgi:hypothetical protein|nr:hypothetical protein [Gaiellaceae bacterium]
MSEPYARPELFVLGSFSDLTQQKPGGPVPNGNDPCRYNDPRATFKQTGTADWIQGNAALQTCALVAAS